MINKCDFLIAADIAADCTNPSVAGVRNTGYIYNYDDIDWDKVSRDAQNPNIIHNLPLVTGKKGYRIYIPGNTPFTGTNTAFVAGTFSNKYTKHIAFVVLDNGAEVCHDIIDQLKNGQFVIVFENKFKGHNGDNAFEIYGFEQGLAQTAGTNDKYSEDTDGGWSIEMEETNAPTAGIFLVANVSGDGSPMTATRALLEGTLTAALS